MKAKHSGWSGYRDGVETLRAPLRIMIGDLIHGRLPSNIQYICIGDGHLTFNIAGCIVEAFTTVTWQRMWTKHHWFVCSYCRRRCRGLFLYFDRLACRQCHGFGYPRKPLKRWW